MKRLARRLVFLVAGLLVLGGLALIGLRLYLGTESARAFIVDQLAAKLGGRVAIDRLDISTFGTSRVQGLRVFEAGSEEMFLDADRVTVDLSALSILLGRRMPGRVELDGLHVKLRFDATGKLLTRLPELEGGGPPHEIRVHHGRVTLAQQGLPPLVLDGLDLATSAKEKDNLTGTLDDPTFGHFTVTGHAGDGLALSLRGQTPRITPAMLQALPFVPRGVWQQVEAEGVEVPLELDFTFQKATPQVRYRIAFDKARVRLLQPDRPALEVHPGRGVLQGSDGEFSLEGNIRDPYWGDWSVAISDRPSDHGIHIALKTTSTRVDQKKLEALPYVPKYIWQQVRAEGQTAVAVDVQLPDNRPGVNYRVALDVADAAVSISAIALNVSSAKGQVLIEDGLVKLDKTAGQAAKGAIVTTATLDFRTAPSTLRFAVEIKDVALRDLPSKWELPSQVEGKVSGIANLMLTLRDSGVETRGSGEGRIDEVKLLGFIKPLEPIKLSLYADGKRFRFKRHGTLLTSMLTSVMLVPPTELPLPTPVPPHQPGTPNALADLAGEALGGVELVTRHIASCTHEALRLLAKVEEPFRSNETTYLDAKVNLEDIDLAELAKRLDFILPADLSGRLSIKMVLGIPVNNAHDLRDYRLNGSAQSSRLAVGGVELRNLAAHVDFARGVLRLRELSGEMTHGDDVGKFTGSARMEVMPRRELSFDGKIDNLPAGALARLMPEAQRRLAGRLAGMVRGRVLVDHLDDPTAWRGAVRLTCPDLHAFGLTLRGLTVGAVLARGKVTLRDLQAEIYKGILTGTGHLDLTGTGAFAANFQLRGADLAGPGALLPPGFSLEGGGDLSGSLSGTTTPVEVKGSGTISTRNVRLGKFRADDLAGDWTLEGDLLRLTQLHGKLYKGAAAGSAEIRLATTTGKVKIHLGDLDAGGLAKGMEGLPLKLEGQVASDIEVSFSPVAGRVVVNSQIDLTAASLRLQGIPTRKLRGRLDWKNDKLDYRLEGETLGGKFSVEGAYPPPPAAPKGQPQGRLRFERLLLERFVRVMRLGPEWHPLSGVVSLSLPFCFEGPNQVPCGQGRFEIADVRWHDTELADTLRGDLRVGPDTITIRDASSTLGGGLMRLSGAYRFTKIPRGWFNVSLSRAEARKLLVVAGLQDKIQGPIDATLRGEIGQEWRGSGSVVLTRGKVAGVPVTDWRVPLEFSFAPDTGQGEVSIRDSSAQIGQGRAQLRGNLRWGSSVRAEGSLLLFDASLAALAGLIGDVSSFVRGQVTGRVDFSGSEMRTLGDLSATVTATLREAQALQMPVLRVLGPYVQPGHSAREFRSGKVRGQLRRGIFRISEMTLESRLVQMIILGTITLEGRLDLDVTAHTVRLGVDPVALRLVARAVPAVGPVPAALIARASDILADRIVHVRLSGTAKTPVVQLEPLRVLSEGAVRLFLGEAIGGGR